MKNVYFVFEFQLDDRDRVRSFGFTLPSMDKAGCDQLSEDMIDPAMDFEGDFGVHDFQGTWNDRTEMMGYGSYEVAEDKIGELMEKWRDYFAQKFGKGKIGPVAELPASLNPNDVDANFAFLAAQQPRQPVQQPNPPSP